MVFGDFQGNEKVIDPQTPYYTPVVTEKSYFLPSGTTITGQITMVSGTAVQGGNELSYNGFYLKASPSNLGTVWIGNSSGTVNSKNGFPLGAGDVVPIQVQNMNQVYFYDVTAGDVISWAKI